MTDYVDRELVDDDFRRRRARMGDASVYPRMRKWRRRFWCSFALNVALLAYILVAGRAN